MKHLIRILKSGELSELQLKILASVYDVAFSDIVKAHRGFEVGRLTAYAILTHKSQKELDAMCKIHKSRAFARHSGNKRYPQDIYVDVVFFHNHNTGAYFRDNLKEVIRDELHDLINSQIPRVQLKSTVTID